MSIILETYYYYVYLSYRRREEGEKSFKSILNHRLTLKIFIFFKCCRLYSKLIITMFIYPTQEGEKELWINWKSSTYVLIFQVENSMKILTFFKILSIILETYHYYVYLSYRKKRDREGSFKSIPNHRLMFWSSKSKIRL